MYIRKAKNRDLRMFEIAIDDINELMATDPRRDIKTVLESHRSPSSVVLIHNDSVLAYGGNQGDNVWFVTSRLTARLSRAEKREFGRKISAYRDLMLDRYGTIWNYVWSGNKSHIRFLKLLGAKFHDEWTVSPVTGERFQLFTISKEDVCVNP